MVVRAALTELFALLCDGATRRHSQSSLVSFLPERGGYVRPQLRDDLLLAHLLHDTCPLVGAARCDDRAAVGRDVDAAGASLRRCRFVVVVILPFVCLRLVLVCVSRSRFREEEARATLSSRELTGVVNFTDAPPAPSPMMARRAHFSIHSARSPSAASSGALR